MRNGFFKIVKAEGGFGIKLFPPVDGGESFQITEIMNYLSANSIDYDLNMLKRAVLTEEDCVFFLCAAPCPVINENYVLSVADDNMSATARFYPASDTGTRLNINEFINDLRYKGIISGIDIEALQNHFMSEDHYCTNFVVAKGTNPVHGDDDKMEFYFNTNTHVKPTVREDGSVDFFNLNNINHCKADDVLARIFKAPDGIPGTNIWGQSIKPRDQKRLTFKHGNNIALSDDGLTLSSMVDGHVMLIEGQVFVSDVFEVENVDLSVGNIDYTGSVSIHGNVNSNLVVKAGGNVVVNGVVEGAQIIAGGNIVIARGMNGMGKGILRAGGDITAKFIENATVEAEGNVYTESILHSNVSAGLEVDVAGKRGFITGGHVQANNLVSVKNLGGEMGAQTVVEVGVDPKIKAEYTQLEKDIAEIVKNIKIAQPVIAGFMEKRAKGARITPEQTKYVMETAKMIEAKKIELQQKNDMLKELQKFFEAQSKAKVVVHGEVFPGTTIVIGELSQVVQSKLTYCCFEVVRGDVKALPL